MIISHERRWKLLWREKQTIANCAASDLAGNSKRFNSILWSWFNNIIMIRYHDYHHGHRVASNLAKKMYSRSWVIINYNHESWIMEIMKILSRSWFIMMDHGWWRKKSNHHGHYNHQKGCTWSQHRVQVELLGLEEASLGDFRGMSRFQQILN